MLIEERQTLWVYILIHRYATTSFVLRRGDFRPKPKPYVYEIATNSLRLTFSFQQFPTLRLLRRSFVYRPLLPSTSLSPSFYPLL